MDKPIRFTNAIQSKYITQWLTASVYKHGWRLEIDLKRKHSDSATSELTKALKQTTENPALNFQKSLLDDFRMVAVQNTPWVKRSRPNALCNLQRYKPTIWFQQNETKAFAIKTNFQKLVLTRPLTHRRATKISENCGSYQRGVSTTAINTQRNAAFLLANFEF